jgi:hypothetical protein
VDVDSNDLFQVQSGLYQFTRTVRLESGPFKDVYEQAYSILRNTPGPAERALSHVDQCERPDATRDAETLALLDQ